MKYPACLNAEFDCYDDCFFCDDPYCCMIPQLFEAHPDLKEFLIEKKKREASS